MTRLKKIFSGFGVFLFLLLVPILVSVGFFEERYFELRSTEFFHYALQSLAQCASVLFCLFIANAVLKRKTSKWLWVPLFCVTVFMTFTMTSIAFYMGYEPVRKLVDRQILPSKEINVSKMNITIPSGWHITVNENYSPLEDSELVSALKLDDMQDWLPDMSFYLDYGAYSQLFLKTRMGGYLFENHAETFTEEIDSKQVRAYRYVVNEILQNPMLFEIDPSSSLEYTAKETEFEIVNIVITSEFGFYASFDGRLSDENEFWQTLKSIEWKEWN